jgi:hypothetical protein
MYENPIRELLLGGSSIDRLPDRVGELVDLFGSPEPSERVDAVYEMVVRQLPSAMEAGVDALFGAFDKATQGTELVEVRSHMIDAARPEPDTSRAWPAGPDGAVAIRIKVAMEMGKPERGDTLRGKDGGAAAAYFLDGGAVAVRGAVAFVGSLDKRPVELRIVGWTVYGPPNANAKREGRGLDLFVSTQGRPCFGAFRTKSAIDQSTMTLDWAHALGAAVFLS